MTTNPHKGDVSFDVSGRTYTLRYNHLALVKVENQLDKGLMQVMEEMSRPNKMRLGTIVVLLWSGLQKHHPNLTMDDAAELLDEIPGGAPEMVKIIDQGFSKAFSQTLGTKGTDPTQRAASGDGTQSSSSSSATATSPIPSGTPRLVN